MRAGITARCHRALGDRVISTGTARRLERVWRRTNDLEGRDMVARIGAGNDSRRGHRVAPLRRRCRRGRRFRTRRGGARGAGAASWELSRQACGAGHSTLSRSALEPRRARPARQRQLRDRRHGGEPSRDQSEHEVTRHCRGQLLHVRCDGRRGGRTAPRPTRPSSSGWASRRGEPAPGRAAGREACALEVVNPVGPSAFAGTLRSVCDTAAGLGLFLVGEKALDVLLSKGVRKGGGYT
jgi:hypothetical protein